ncbi:putative polyol transporter 2 [Syzygium oleosum]|uniref:putative polyol transporter 2 n=1 Tax=Syzygium oleosum TaxID=219896 RepID=UPI0024B8CE46|nr:putative polyol transporter 2 [Syzygium oleosum]
MDLKVSEVHLDVLTRSLSMFTFLGLVTARWISDQFGCHKTIMVARIIYLVGPLLMGFAPCYSVFLAGCSCATFGAGFALMITAMYATEISPLFSCGFYVSFPHMFISFGNQVANYFSKRRR